MAVLMGEKSLMVGSKIHNPIFVDISVVSISKIILPCFQFLAKGSVSVTSCPVYRKVFQKGILDVIISPIRLSYFVGNIFFFKESPDIAVLELTRYDRSR